MYASRTLNRISVVGPSGSGKTTLATTIGERCDISTIDLDTLFHRPGWKPSPTPEFRARVAAAIDQPRWAVAGNYSVVMDLVQGRADTIVWLDLPRWRTTARVARRSFWRVVRREPLWNGNREQLRNLLKWDPEENIIRWAWWSYPKIRDRYEGFATGEFWAHATVHRLRSPKEVDRFVASLKE